MDPRGPAFHGPGWNSHPPTNLRRYELFEKGSRCGQGFVGKIYLAMYWMEFQEPDVTLHSPLFENTKEGHVEKHLLEHVLRQLSVTNKERLKSITIMQNASPCRGCSDRYKQELEGPGVKVVIIFSSFYLVRRLSCRHEGHHHSPIRIDDHQQNREGLRQLNQAGFVLKTTCFEDWRRMCTALQIPPEVIFSEQQYPDSQRGHEDQNMENDLEFILS